MRAICQLVYWYLCSASLALCHQDDCQSLQDSDKLSPPEALWRDQVNLLRHRAIYEETVESKSSSTAVRIFPNVYKYLSLLSYRNEEWLFIFLFTTSCKSPIIFLNILLLKKTIITNLESHFLSFTTSFDKKKKKDSKEVNI